MTNKKQAHTRGWTNNQPTLSGSPLLQPPCCFGTSPAFDKKSLNTRHRRLATPVCFPPFPILYRLPPLRMDINQAYVLRWRCFPKTGLTCVQGLPACSISNEISSFPCHKKMFILSPRCFPHFHYKLTHEEFPLIMGERRARSIKCSMKRKRAYPAIASAGICKRRTFFRRSPSHFTCQILASN